MQVYRLNSAVRVCQKYTGLFKKAELQLKEIKKVNIV